MIQKQEHSALPNAHYLCPILIVQVLKQLVD